MASKNTSTRIVLVVVAPLLVGVASGLIVEWLKPGEKKRGSESDTIPTTKRALQESAGTSNNDTLVANDRGAAAFLGKWYRVDNEDFRMEILPNGKYIFKNGEKETPYDYTVKENNIIRSEKGDVSVEIYFASSDELVYHFHEHNRVLPDVDWTIRYKRGEPSHLWRNIFIGVGITIFVLAILNANGLVEVRVMRQHLR